MKLMEIVSLVRAARARPGDPKPVVVGGARELAPLLARELRAGGTAGAVRENGDPRGAAVFVWIGAADANVLRQASRAQVPIVGITQGESLPYVLDTNLVVVRSGAGLPIAEVARAIAAVLGADGVRLASHLPVLRDPLASQLVRREARASALLAASTEPVEALGVVAINQVQLAGRLASLADAIPARIATPLMPLVAIVTRKLARRVTGRLPRSRVVRAGLAYGATRAVGEAVRRSVRSRT